MDFLSSFQMPKSMNITGRTSSITNAFINSIIPVIKPTEAEVKQALEILAINPNDLRCAYCGSVATEWDHLRPIVIDRKPTGYISEIYNLVPACGKCNQSKGNKPWKEWIVSKAKLSPKTRGINDLNDRIKRLEIYETWGTPKRVEFVKVVSRELLDKHWKNLETIIDKMREAQELANQIKSELGTHEKHGE